MAQVTTADRSVLPREIRRALGRVDRRLRGLAAIKGVGTAVLVAAVGAAAGMAVDFEWGLSPAVRWGVWGAWVAAVAVPLLAMLARLSARRPDDLALAGILEQADPSLGERLTGAVDLLERPAHGSPGLIRALAEEAAGRVGAVNPAVAAPSRGAWRRLMLGVAAGAVVVAPSVWRDDPFGMLVRRFAAPWIDSDRIGRFAVAVQPGDVVLAKGDDLKVSATVEPRFALAGSTAAPGAAWLEWTEAGTGKTRRMAMKPKNSAARAFAAVVPKLMGDATYRVVSRSGESRKFRAKAVEPPVVKSVEARVEPPSYTKFPAVKARRPARVEALEGSRVTLTIEAAAPVASVEVAWPAPGKDKVETRPATVAPDGRSATLTLLADVSGLYRITLHDANGLVSRPEPPRRLSVRPDAPPTLAVRGSRGDVKEEARGDDTLRVALAARDDVAVASVEIHYQIERASSSEEGKTDKGLGAMRVQGLDSPSARGEAVLALKTLGVKPGDVVSWRVRVADNRPAPKGPNVVWSAERRLSVVAKAEPLWAREGQAARQSVQAELDALKKSAAENRQATELLRYAADAARNGNGVFDDEKARELARREVAARELIENLNAFARRLDDDSAFQPLARAAKQAADVEAEAARATLDKARQADDPGKRFADLRLADTRLSAVSLRLEEIQRDLNVLAEREAEIRRLQELADRQTEVAEHAEKGPDDKAPAPPDRLALDKLAAEQNAVKNDLEAILKKSPELRAAVLADEVGKAEDLARRARDVADRQRAEARRATDLTRKADALHRLADEQRAIEEAARRLALDVDAPLIENGRARLNVDPIRQAAEPLERGDLAPSHYHLAVAEAELRRLARDLDDTPGDVKALAYRLARRQDQINADLGQALGDARGKPNLPADERAALAQRLAPLAERQLAIADLAAAILKSPAAKAARDAEPKFPRDAAEKAAAETARAALQARSADNPREAEARANEARNALHRLAGELPDLGRREAPARQAFAQARQTADAVAHEVDQHLRETERPGDPNYSAAKGAAELARRLAPLTDRVQKAAELLAKTPPLHRTGPQSDRAVHRARALADAIEAARALGKHDPNAPPPPGFDADRARVLRDALADAAQDSRLGFERLEQKLNGQAPADDVADELAGEQQARAAARQKNVKQNKKENEQEEKKEILDGRADDQRRIAAALRSLKAPDAALEQAEAVRLAERAAEANAPDAAVRRAAEGVMALADRLNDRQSPRDRARGLAQTERGMNDPAALASDPAVDSARQRAIAAALARLPLSRSSGDLAAGAKAAEAVKEAAALADKAKAPDEPVPGQGKPTAALRAAARAKAAEALEALATRLGPSEPPEEQAHVPGPTGGVPPRDPDLMLDPAHADQARALARRERRLHESLLAVLGDEVKPQQELRRDSAALGRDLAELRDRARELSPRAHGPAAEAAALLGEQAPQAMNNAVDQLAGGQPDPARASQRQAAELAERGAQRADDLAAALRAESDAHPVGDPDGQGDPDAKHRPDPRALSAARAAMGDASRALGQARQPQAQPNSPAPLADARRAMRAAADRLQDAAHAARARNQSDSGKGEPDRSLAESKPSSSSDPTNQEPTGTPAGTADPETLRQIQDLVRRKTGRKWGELPGHLRTEILQTSQGRYRDDYARLIQLYYREIAAGAATTGGRP